MAVWWGSSRAVKRSRARPLAPVVVRVSRGIVSSPPAFVRTPHHPDGKTAVREHHQGRPKRSHEKGVRVGEFRDRPKYLGLRATAQGQKLRRY